MEKITISGTELFENLKGKEFLVFPKLNLEGFVDERFLTKHLEKYAFIPSRIVKRLAVDKRLNGKPSKFVEISSKEISSVLTTRFYSKITTDLINAKIIERSNYQPGTKSYGYRFTRKYRKFTECTILVRKKKDPKKSPNNPYSSSEIIQYISENISNVTILPSSINFILYAYYKSTNNQIRINKSNNNKYTIQTTTNTSNDRQPPYVFTFFDKIYNELSKRLDRKKYDHNCFIYDLVSVAGIGSGECMRVKRDRTSDRVHTPLTSLRSTLRYFLKIRNSDEDLVSIDLANSQVFLVNMHLKMIGVDFTLPDVKHFYELTSRGEFYEFIQEKTKLESRDKVKKQFFSGYFFCKNDRGYRLFTNVMRNSFPTVHKFIVAEKHNDHSSLAIKLQKAESSFFIDRIVKRLMLESHSLTFISPIHDSIITNKSNTDFVQKIIKEEFELDDFYPTLKTKEYDNWPNQIEVEKVKNLEFYEY